MSSESRTRKHKGEHPHPAAKSSIGMQALPPGVRRLIRALYVLVGLHAALLATFAGLLLLDALGADDHRAAMALWLRHADQVVAFGLCIAGFAWVALSLRLRQRERAVPHVNLLVAAAVVYLWYLLCAIINLYRGISPIPAAWATGWIIASTGTLAATLAVTVYGAVVLRTCRRRDTERE